MNEHKPGCGVNKQCAVFHADGVCNHETYGKCTCHSQPSPEKELIDIQMNTIIDNAKQTIHPNYFQPSVAEDISEEDGFIRDVTRAGSIPKSEVREKLERFTSLAYAQGKQDERKRVVGIIKQRIAVGGGNDSNVVERILDNNRLVEDILSAIKEDKK